LGQIAPSLEQGGRSESGLMSALARLLRHPPSLWMPLLLYRASTFWRTRLEAWRDRRAPTFFTHTVPHLKNRLHEAPAAADIVAESPWLAPVCALFLEHRFDWLGTGWRELDYRDLAVDAEGVWLQSLVSSLNLVEAQRIWRLIDTEDYRPIDWHSDHRAAHRWDSRRLSSELAIYPGQGADIKQPWELARLQHLPLLALAYRCSAAEVPGFAPAEHYRREFRNVVLDFIATNPPRHGVNWMCSMDVAIRIANILVARDLFSAAGATFDFDFENVLAQTTVTHGRHIRAHLERRPDARSNHYLANLAGLLYAAAYLGRQGEAAAWWRFARRQLEAEVEHQFHADGSNFEASTGYHRLSGEIALWSAALILGEEGDKSLGSTAQMRLASIGRFVEILARPDGRIPAIGDVDSGRFMKLSGPFDAIPREAALARYPHLEGAAWQGEVYWDEALDNHASLVQACAALQKNGVAVTLEAFVLQALAAGNQLSQAPVPPPAYVQANWAHLLDQIRSESRHPARRYVLPLDDDLVPTPHAYPAFGLYVFRGSGWLLTIRCGRNGQDGNGGHAHNDQLSLTFSQNGRVLIEDPGTAVYHSDPNLRNAYRSVRAHFAPRPMQGEPASLEVGPFMLPDDAEGTCLYFGEHGFIGRHKGYGYAVSRVIRRDSQAWVVEDYSNGEELVDLEMTAQGAWLPPVPVAQKYGRPCK
jgi:hypothetical protein